MNFTAIDFETATAQNICAVGIVTVEDGKIVDEYYSLVKPPENRYNWHNTNVHGISADDTINSPTFIEIYPEIKKRLQGRVMVAHNESFDRNVLINSMINNGLDYEELDISDRWECTMRACRANSKYPSGKLSECCEVEGIELMLP